MNEPTVNVPLLRKVLEHITAHPEEWNQEYWVTKSTCGTACCVAGWTVLETGYRLNKGSLDFRRDGKSYLGHVLDKEGESRLIPHVAREELGLSELQGRQLFSSLNTLPDLWRWAEEFTDGEIQPPPNLPTR